MSRNSVVVAAPLERVFAVLDDPCAYPRWVVGARRVRHVDPEWPAIGARFHHALGAPGTELHDSTRIVERDPPRHLRLEVRFRPAGVAVVDLRLTPVAEGTRVDIEERPVSGPLVRVPGFVVDRLLTARNAWSLHRLRGAVAATVTDPVDDPSEEPADLGRLLAGRSVATAESCTGGLVAQTLAREEGSGDWFRGGVVTYQRDTKFALLDVTPGPVVSPRAAREMAQGVARRFDADAAVSVTGAAGPDPHDGAAPGTVVVGVLVDGAAQAHELHLPGDPPEVCARATAEALRLLRAALAARADGSPTAGPGTEPGPPREAGADEMQEE